MENKDNNPKKRRKGKKLIPRNPEQVVTVHVDKIEIAGKIHVQMREPDAPQRKDYKRQQVMLRLKGFDQFAEQEQATLIFDDEAAWAKWVADN